MVTLFTCATPGTPASYAINNQLLSYDPSTNTWTNAKCSGEPTSPRYMASAANIQNNVWLYGGRTKNICSFVWTKIKTSMPINGRNKASLTPISTNQLLFCEGSHQNMHGQNITIISWIYDVQSHQWRKHSTAEIHHELKHTGITGLNRSVIIFVGQAMPCKGSQHHSEKSTFYLMLEPTSLQQLAIQMIHKHRSKLPWENLPNSLICKIKNHRPRIK